MPNDPNEIDQKSIREVMTSSAVLAQRAERVFDEFRCTFREAAELTIARGMPALISA